MCVSSQRHWPDPRHSSLSSSLLFWFTARPCSLDPEWVTEEMDSVHTGFLFSLLATGRRLASQRKNQEKEQERTETVFSYKLGNNPPLPAGLGTSPASCIPSSPLYGYISLSNEFPTIFHWEDRELTWGLLGRLKWALSSQDPRLHPEQLHFYLTTGRCSTNHVACRRHYRSAIKNRILVI